MSDAPERVISDFKEAVNMTAHQLKAWLEREMRDVGMRRAGRARGARYELR